MTDWLLAPDAARAFLRDHWQRQPLFLPAAMPTAPRAVDWRELACSDEVESRRVVTESNGQFRLEHGPFSAPELHADGSDAPWTVLIQDADQFDPRLRVLLQRFRFLPDWRVEDVMMSFATPGASVGPHVDAYDVFLVQAEGERHWQVGAPGSALACDADGDNLRLVQAFDSVLDVIARPGDVLYLPPGVPHHGIAVTDCVTLSIGFRAPDVRELSAALLEDAVGEARYADPPLTPAANPAHIDAAAIDAARRLLVEGIDLSTASVARTLGRLVTEPKDWLLPEPPDRAPDPAALRQDLREASAALCLTDGSRIAFTAAPDLLFVNGDAFELTSSSQPLAASLARDRRLHGEALRRAADDAATIALLSALLASGALYWRDAD